MRVTSTSANSNQPEALPEDTAKAVSVALGCLQKSPKTTTDLKSHTFSLGHPPTSADRILR